MDVDQPLREGIDQLTGDDPHPAGHHQQIDAGRTEAGDESLIQRLTAVMEAVVMQLAGDAQPLGPLLSTAVVVVDHQQHHLSRQFAPVAGGHQGFEIAAVAGGHHPKPQPSGHGCQRLRW